MKMTAYDMPRSYWRQVAESAGILKKTFDNRIARGWSPQRAATQPVCEGKGWRTSIRDNLRAMGLPEDAVSRYRKYHGSTASDDEILAQIIEERGRVTLKEQAEAAGLDRRTVYWRLANGWTLERALSTPPLPPGSTIYANRRAEK